MNNLEPYLEKGLLIIHGEETRDEIITLLKAKGSPPERLGRAALVVLTKMDSVAPADIFDQVRITALIRFIVELADIAEAAKIFKADEDDMGLALSYTIQEYIKMEIGAGRIDQKELQASVSRGLAKMSPAERADMDQATTRLAKRADQYGDQ